MKKVSSILFSLVLLLSLTFLTSCGKQKLSMFDENTGYKAELTLPSEDFVITEIDNESGAFPEIEFKNEKLKFTADTYFYTTFDDQSFYESKESQKSCEVFKEYNFNGYDAYAYNQFSFLNVNILVKHGDEENDALVLYFNLDVDAPIDDVAFTELLDTKEMQDFFNSLKFSETK